MAHNSPNQKKLSRTLRSARKTENQDRRQNTTLKSLAFSEAIFLAEYRSTLRLCSAPEDRLAR